MKEIAIILILFINLIANDEQQENIHIWTQKEEPSIENNFQENKNVYQTNNIEEAIGATLIESLFHIDKIKKKKKLNSDFEYLKEFENSIKDK
jgi:hypothetical protein